MKSLQTKRNMNQLDDACERGDLEVVTSLLSNEECDINAHNTRGESPLHIACKYDHLEIVKILLKNQQCDLNTQNRHGDTPLHLACSSKSLGIVRLLLEKKCSTNIPDKKGETAQNIPLNEDGDRLLHIACQWGNVDIVRYLITDESCDVNIQNTHLNTPLHLACYLKNISITRLLLEQKCNTIILNKKGKIARDIPLNEDGDCLLHIACQWGDVNIVKYLTIDQRCVLSIQNTLLNTPLHIACYLRLPNIIRLLLERKCSTNIPNEKSETAQDIPLNEDGDYLLHIACRWGDVNIVKYLIIDQRCVLSIQNTHLNTPLHIACYLRLPSIIRLLLEQKCSTNIPNKKGEIAQNIPLNEDGDCLLHVACQWDDVNIVKYLIIDQRCVLSTRNTHLNTPLHNACYLRLPSIIRLLLKLKCSTNILNKKGEIAQNIPLNENGDCLLHIACKWGDVNIVKYLTIAQKCVLSIQNTHLNTPLHIACYLRSLSIIRLLLKLKCSTNILNKKGEIAQNIPLNEDGDYLLHIACHWGDVGIVRYLITDERCDPNVKSCISENTPLHIAAKYGHNDTIVQLLSYRECNPNAKNKDGDTPLHFAAKFGRDIIIDQLLSCKECDSNAQNKGGDTPLHTAAKYNIMPAISQLLTSNHCNPNVQNKEGDTPLHIAAKYGEEDTIVQLLSCKEWYPNVHNSKGCNPNFQNRDGDTPLHIAVRNNRVHVISQLLSNTECNPNIVNKEGDTPLHIAVRNNRVHVISRLLSNTECNSNIVNKEGDTPLHIAVRNNRVHVISQLLSNTECNPNIVNKEGDTPLHVAIRQKDTIIQLLSCKQCNPNVCNKYGNTPLHIAVKENITTAIPLLLNSKGCNLNIQNKDGDTPLHIAVRNSGPHVISQLLNTNECNPNILNMDHSTPLLMAIKCNNSTVATALLQHKCDPTLCDPHGNTALHLACIGGETQSEMVEVAKQLLTSVDPSCVNDAGQTPIELTTNYQLIQAISHFAKCMTKQPVQTYINIFIVGNPETGKSTLVKAICKEATSILWKFVPKQVRRVKTVSLRTAGIIPTTFRSKTFGNTVIYDLAGQVEYYTSHAAVIQSTVISTPPVFIVVVNLSESEQKISETLRYWWYFINNHASRSSAPPEVILVGSHADIVKSTGGSIQENVFQISALLTQLPVSFHFAGRVFLDCRDPASKELKHFCSLVNQSCTVLRQTADIDLRCHVLYAFLLDRFEGKVACTVSDVASSVQENSEFLPQNPDSLIPLISTLSDKGLLLLVEGSENHEDWWIILQKQALLSKMNGVIFAPKDFRQHRDLSWSTGVVPFSKLKNEFPDYNSIMVSEFLTHLEFCFKIKDRETLSLLKNEAVNVEDTSSDISEEYYFFPSLVSVENPLHVWEQNDDMCCKSGWLYQCIRPDQFLTTQFLHVLILRLAFTFALKLDPGDCREDSLALRRKCSVWKHGIAWLNRVRIETVVEVGLQYQSVIVMMRCPKGKEAKCVQLRSEVIQKILEAKDEHCKAVKMSESFIHPTDVRYPFTDNMGNVNFYSLTEIARGIICNAEEANALDQRGRNPIPVQDLLLLDPYSTDTSAELLRELFSEKHSMDETVKSQVLETLKSKSEVNLLLCVRQYQI